MKYGRKDWLHYPENDPRGLVLGISNSGPLVETIREYLMDLNFAVAGPFKSVNQIIPVLDTQLVDVIIVDGRSSLEEISTLEYLLNHAYTGLSVVLLSNSMNPISYDNLHQLSLPLNPEQLNRLLNTLIYHSQENQEIVVFINSFIKKILEMIPIEYKNQLIDTLIKNLKIFQNRNNELKFSTETLTVVPVGPTAILETRALGASFKLLVDDIIEEIENKAKIGWMTSLVDEVTQSVISQFELTDELSQFLKFIHPEITQLQQSLELLTPDLKSKKQDIISFITYLGDEGPEIRLKKAQFIEKTNIITYATAGHLLTLVGQGEEYHEGVFGPVPLLNSNEYVVLICSRKIQSRIKDPRMKGSTICLLVVGFSRDMIGLLPSRDEVKRTFKPFNELAHLDQMTETVQNRVINALGEYFL